MGRLKGTILKPRLIPAQRLSVYTRYVKRSLEERGVPERNQPANDDLIDVLVARLGDWLDWKRIDEFIDSEVRKRGSWAFREERPEPEHKNKARPKRKAKHGRAAS
jgi:hypothetical protein